MSDTVRPGLCSVTLRSAAPRDVIRLARDAGLKGIEWGADVHVPVGDLAHATAVREGTEEAGLSVASYGSYLRLGTSTAQERDDVVRTAAALHAPRIRVWAGDAGSAETTAGGWTAAVTEARALSDLAGRFGMVVGLEFHAGTLTDSAASTSRLLDDIDRPGRVGTYWQPPLSMEADEALAGFDLLSPRIMAVHAFSWWPGPHRLALTERRELWLGVLQRLDRRGIRTDVLLEFVRDDSPAQLREDARSLENLRRSHPGGAAAGPTRVSPVKPTGA